MCLFVCNTIVSQVYCMQYAMNNMEYLWGVNPLSCANAFVPVISMVEVKIFVLINVIVKQINFFI
jgi:hypothetical protein